MQIPKVKSEKIVYDGYFSLQEDLLETGDILSPFTVLNIKKEAVVVLAKDTNGKWILNKEYRHATKEILIGCPGGRLEHEEDPIDGGKREFLEETGYSFEKGKLLGSCYPFPGVCSQKIYFVYGEMAKKVGGQNLDPLECIEPITLSDNELEKLIQSGHPIDGILLTALWFKKSMC